MKGYETAFDICKIVNKDDKIKEYDLLVYPGGWRDDFFSIIIKNFYDYDDNVRYATELVKNMVEEYDDWTFTKDFYDEKLNLVEVQAKQI